MIETIEMQEADAEMIFRQITRGGDFLLWEDAERAVVALYVFDMTISRAGISRALERLQRHYAPQATQE